MKLYIELKIYKLTKLSILIEHSKMLYNIALKAGDIFTSTEEFQLLNRVIQDQTTEDAAKIYLLKIQKI